jgi:hypothetical protein
MLPKTFAFESLMQPNIKSALLMRQDKPLPHCFLSPAKRRKASVCQSSHLTFFQKVMEFVMAANAAFILTTVRKKCIL